MLHILCPIKLELNRKLVAIVVVDEYIYISLIIVRQIDTKYQQVEPVGMGSF